MTNPCSTPGCGKPAKVKGLCGTCYQRAYKKSRAKEAVEATVEWEKLSDVERLESMRTRQQAFVAVSRRELDVARGQLDWAESGLAALDHVLERARAGELDLTGGLEVALQRKIAEKEAQDGAFLSQMEKLDRRIQAIETLIEMRETGELVDVELAASPS